MRTRLRAAGPCLLLALTVPLAGCTGSSPHPAHSSSSPPGDSSPAAAGQSVTPAISLAAARSLLRRYVRVNNAANARLNPRLEAKVEGPPQLTVDEAGYVVARHTRTSIKPFTYRRRAFYIPALAATAQRWFAVSATTGSGGHAERQFLLFVQQYSRGPWKVDSVVVSAGGDLPVALGPTGTAMAGTAGDRHLAVAPSDLPATHAEYINSKHHRSAAGFAAGRWTSTLVQGIRSFSKDYTKAGWKYDDRWAAVGAPVYVLRSKDGGAVVWYFLKDQQSATRMTSGRPLHSGTVVEALAGTSQINHRFTIISASAFVAVIPPKGKGKIVVTGGATGNVGASTS